MSLRIIWSSNAIWASTGYGVQAKSILPRLQKLGHEVAQFAWYGLQGGTMEADGIKIYPAAYDHWGVDVIGAHVKHFNADLVISLQDIWVLPEEYVQRCRPARWACVASDTLVMGSDGKEVAIQTIDPKSTPQVFGATDGKVVTAGLQMQHDNALRATLELETATGRRLCCTGDHHILVNRQGHVAWLEANCILPGDMVHCIAVDHITQEEQREPQAEEWAKRGAAADGAVRVSGGHQGRGVGLSGRDYRWRGDNHLYVGAQAEALSYRDSAEGRALQWQRRSDAVVAGADWLGASTPCYGVKAAEPTWSAGMADRALGFQSVQPAGGCVALLDREAAASGSAAGLHRVSGEREVWSSLWRDGDGHGDGGPALELEEVVAIRNAGVRHVYDLTTTSHDYFANGMLVHNCWFPIDQQPVPARVVKLAKTADYPITYSEFGQREALAAGLQNSQYIPHGIETTLFKPGDKLAARQRMKLPADAFVCAMVAANKGTPSRKAFAENLLAFGAFRRAHNNALLYLHTLESQATGGVDFNELIPACGIPHEAIRFVDQYHYTLGLPAEYLATVYQASDVLLAASQSEGFGIPIIEAQACGCPVITTDCTSMTELTINGIATPPVQRFWTPLNSWAFVPSPAAIQEALETIWRRTPAEAAAEAQRGVTHVHQNYDWDVLVRDWWAPFLAQVEQDVRQASWPCQQPVTWPLAEVVEVVDA